jgi:hypothetical protein
MKGMQIGKDNVRLYLFVDDMIIYLKDPYDSTRNVRHFSKVAGYKISIQKSVAFLYTNNEQVKKKSVKQSHS